MGTAVLFTLQEFLARPEREDSQQEELIEGELIVSPAPKPQHAHIVEELREALRPLRQLGFVVVNDFSCTLSGVSMVSPDLAAVRNDRWQAAISADTWLENSPELVIEVASPSNRRLHRKATLYLEHGAEQVWIVSPKRRSVSVLTSDDTIEAREGETIDFHGVSISVTDLFQI